MPSVNGTPVLPGVYTQVQTQLLPSVTGGIRVACFIGSGRLTNLVVGESKVRGATNTDVLANPIVTLDGTTVTDQNYAVYQLGHDYIKGLSFNVTTVTDGTHLVVSSTTGLTAGDTISQTNEAGTFTTTITTVTDGTHLVVGSTTNWTTGQAVDTSVGDLTWLLLAAQLTSTNHDTYSGLVSTFFSLAVGSGAIQNYTFISGDFSSPSAATALEVVDAITGGINDTTASVSTTITSVTDSTHLVVASTTGMTGGDTLVQGAHTTTITTVTDGTHLVVGSTLGFHAANFTGVTASVTASGGHNFVTITTTANTNSSLTIENGTANSILGFTAGSLVSTPQQPALGITYFVNYEWAKAVGDGQGSFTPKFYFLQNFSTITNDYGAVGGGNDGQLANMNNAWTLPIAAQLAQENGASIVCLMQLNPAGGASVPSQVRSALTQLFIPNINIVVSLTGSVNNMLIADITNHVVEASSTINRLERTAFIGFSATDPSFTNSSTMLGYATAASSNRVVVVNQNATTYSMFIGTNTIASTVDGTMMAAALAAVRTNPAFDVAIPLTREVVSGIATTNTLPQAEKVILSNNGVLIVDNISGSAKVVFGTTTDFADILDQLYQVIEIADYCTQTIRGLLDPIFIGQKLLANTPSQVQTVTSAILSDIEASNIIESFTQPTATVNPLQPTQILVNVGVQPVLELDTIFITLGLNLV